MFDRSRNRIVLSIMGSVILLFAVTMAVIVFASYREVRQRNTDMLERYAETYSREQPGDWEMPDPPPDEGWQEPPGDPPGLRDRLDERPDFQLSTFYSVAVSKDGTVLSVDDGEKDVYNEEELTALASQILAGNRRSGRTGSLNFTVREKNGYTLVAFIDNTVSENGLHTMVRNVLIIGGLSVILLYLLSLTLSRRIIRPLEENDAKQKRFISDASHELKTPVAAIGANVEILSREIGGNEWLSNIRYENERMGGLVAQLLELSRAENAQVPMEELDLSRLVQGEVLALESLAFDAGREIVCDTEEELVLNGNRSQLSQLVSTLLDNAIEYSSDREIRVSLRKSGHSAVLSVVNRGEEIPAEQREHLFERFYRTDEARSGEGRHYGLGLSIAKAVAESHGGTLTVDCHDGFVEFRAELPLVHHRDG